MKSKTRIKKQTQRKTDPFLVETLKILRKTNQLVAAELSKPKRKWLSINLREIDSIKGDVLIPGKVLGSGELSSSKKIVAWAFSKKAEEKIRKSGSVFFKITEEIKKNPKLNNLTIINNGKNLC